MKKFRGKIKIYIGKLLEGRAKKRSHQETIEAKYAESVKADEIKDPVKATAAYVTDMVRDESTNSTKVLAATIDSETPEGVFREAVKQIVQDPTIPNSPIAAAVDQSDTNLPDEQIIRLLEKVPFSDAADIRVLIGQIDDQDKREEQILVSLQNYYNSDFSNSNEEDVINRLKGVYSTFDFENEDIDNIVQRIVAKQMAIMYHRHFGRIMPQKYKEIPPTTIEKMLEVNMPKLVVEEFDKLYPKEAGKCNHQTIDDAIRSGMRKSINDLNLIYDSDLSKISDQALIRKIQEIYYSLDYHNEEVDKLIQKIVAKQMAFRYKMFTGGVMPQRYNELPPTTIEKMMEVDMPTLVGIEYETLFPENGEDEKNKVKYNPSIMRMAILKKLAEKVAVVHKKTNLWVIPSSESMKKLDKTERQYFLDEILKREMVPTIDIPAAEFDIVQQIDGNYDVDERAQKELASALNSMTKADRLRAIKTFLAFLDNPEAERIIRIIAEDPKKALDCILKFESTGALKSTMELSASNRIKALNGYKAALNEKFLTKKNPEDSNPGEGSGVAGNPGGNPGENPGGNPSGNPGGDPGGEPGGRGASNPPVEDKDHTL